MILFLDEDRAYLSWVAHHRQGFVLDGKRKAKLSQLVLHRATCPAIKSAPSRRFHWTTGAKLKACSLHREELAAWVAEQTVAAPASCAACRPDCDDEASRAKDSHPSKLGREILDYVLDAVVIHLEHEYPPYRLTIGDISACFAKSPGQLAPALRRLSDEGFISVAGGIGANAARAARQMVFPTRLALKTLAAFEGESDAALQAELDKLQSA